MTKCSKCGKESEGERSRFFELVWRCDLVLSQTIWKGLLCGDCSQEFAKNLIPGEQAAKRLELAEGVCKSIRRPYSYRHVCGRKQRVESDTLAVDEQAYAKWRKTSGKVGDE